MSKILFCYTIADTFHFSIETILMLKEKGHEVTIMSSNKEKLKQIADELRVNFEFLDLSRDFSIGKDIINLVKLFFILRRIKPTIIVGATPKAALVSMIASFFARIHYRVYHIFGLPFETAVGLKRNVLSVVEKITCLFASDVIPISRSVKEIYIEKFPLAKSKMRDFALLTVGGVDISKFEKDKFLSSSPKIKEKLGIPKEKLVIGFVARLTNDKGFGDFIAMWKILTLSREDIVALIIGSSDTRDSFDLKKSQSFFSNSEVYHLDFTQEVEKYMSIMDVFVLPSFREGFGNVNAEASSMKIPVVSYDVTGCRDSVKNGVSGILVEKNDVDALAKAVSGFLDSNQERVKYGEQGRKLIEMHFTRTKVAENFCEFCLHLSAT